MTPRYREDASITAPEDAALRRLLLSCFPHEPAFLRKRYLRERPAHRWLVTDPAGEIIAHTAVHDKTVGTGQGDLSIGAVAEVCVSSNFRRKGLVKEMLAAVHEWLPAEGIAFAMLFGHPRIYGSSGYFVIGNEVLCENTLLNQLNPFAGKPMVRCLTETSWPAGGIDLRGPKW